MKTNQKLSSYRGLFSHKITLWARGGSDQSDEWYPNGDQYAYIYKISNNTDHNYFVEFNKHRPESGIDLKIFLSLDGPDSKTVKLLSTTFLTIGEAKWFTVEFIRDYEFSNHFAQEVMPFLMKKCHDVYIIEDDEIKHVGKTIFGVSADFNNKHNWFKFRYYQKEYVHLQEHVTYYDIEHDGTVHVTEIKVNRGFTTYCLSVDEKPQLYSRLLLNHKLNNL